MYSLKIDDQSFEVAVGSLLGTSVKELMKELKTIADLVKEDIQENIMRSRAVPVGSIAKNTKVTEKLKGHGHPLFNTGKLHDAISVKSIKNGFMVYIANKDGRDVIGSRLQDGYIQEKIFGRFMKVARKVPARPFFGIRAELEKQIQGILNNG